MKFDFSLDECIVIAKLCQELVDFNDGTKYNSQKVAKSILIKMRNYLECEALKMGIKGVEVK